MRRRRPRRIGRGHSPAESAPADAAASGRSARSRSDAGRASSSTNGCGSQCRKQALVEPGAVPVAPLGQTHHLAAVGGDHLAGPHAAEADQSRTSGCMASAPGAMGGEPRRSPDRPGPRPRCPPASRRPGPRRPVPQRIADRQPDVDPHRIRRASPTPPPHRIAAGPPRSRRPRPGRRRRPTSGWVEPSTTRRCGHPADGHGPVGGSASTLGHRRGCTPAVPRPLLDPPPARPPAPCSGPSPADRQSGCRWRQLGDRRVPR